MKAKNVKDLENLSLFCHMGGLVMIFLGILVGVISLVSKQFGQIQSGIYVFISGYAFVKISGTIARIIKDEEQGEMWGQKSTY